MTFFMRTNSHSCDFSFVFYDFQFFTTLSSLPFVSINGMSHTRLPNTGLQYSCKTYRLS